MAMMVSSAAAAVVVVPAAVMVVPMAMAMIRTTAIPIGTTRAGRHNKAGRKAKTDGKDEQQRFHFVHNIYFVACCNTETLPNKVIFARECGF